MACNAVSPPLVLRAALALNPVFHGQLPTIPSSVPTVDAAIVPLRHVRAAVTVRQVTMTAHSRKPLPQSLGRAQVDVHQVAHALPVFHHPRKLKGTGRLRPCFVKMVLLADRPNVLQAQLVQGLLDHSGLRHHCSATNTGFHQES